MDDLVITPRESARTGTTEPEGAATGCGGHTCTCGEVDQPGHPELDVRPIPHSIRHATVLGALESLQPGAGLALVAPHDPLPPAGPGAAALAGRASTLDTTWTGDPRHGD